MIATEQPEARLASPHSATLEIKNLGLFQNHRWLFRGVNMTIPAGSFVAVTGPSGVGKTSFLGCLAGTRTPTEGEISYVMESTGERLHPDHFRERLGIVWQNFLLTQNASALTNVLCGRLKDYSCWQTLFGFPKKLQVEACEILCSLGLENHCHRRACQVSGGEQQRIAIARALFQQPSIYLADEPVAHLDLELKERVLTRLKQESQAWGRTVFCVLHDHGRFERYADYALELNRQDPEGWSLSSIAA